MSTTDEQMRTAAEGLLAPQEPKAEPELTEEVETPEAEVEEEETGEQQEETAPETDDDDEEPAPVAAPEKYTVKADGKEIEVTLDDLKRAYSGQAHIQKGMQEAADAKKQAQSLYEALQAEQAKFLAVVEQVQTAGFKAPPKAPDPALSRTDPIGYMQAEADYRVAMQEYQAQQQQIAQAKQRHDAMQAKAYEEYVTEQVKALQERIPEFKDPQKGAELKAKLVKTGVDVYGFSPDEMSGISDARYVQVLHDAARWRELQATKTTAKKAPEPPKNVRPAAKRPEPEQLVRKRELEKARQVGKPEAFVDLMFKRK